LSSRVINSSEVAPVRGAGDTAEVRLTFDGSRGCERLEQRVIRFDVGRSQPRSLDGRQEILYVVSGEGTIDLGERAHEVGAECGVFLAAGETYAIENPGPAPLVVVSVLAPEEGAPAENRKVVVHFADQPELRADAKRTFRYLVNQEAGCLDVTQFVGIVEPCRAPDHSHTYDEVGYIVEGEGIAHVGGKQTPIKAGSCFHLPPEHIHCIENNGAGVMRIMGVFHPSGDPASRSYDEARSN
jgi:mannose-6-phosphate isomerase-like protein (cupin superfamily)